MCQQGVLDKLEHPMSRLCFQCALVLSFGHRSTVTELVEVLLLSLSKQYFYKKTNV